MDRKIKPPDLFSQREELSVNLKNGKMMSKVLLYLLMITCMLTRVSSTEVKWKVRDTSPKLGQDLTLFCKVDNCTVHETRRWYGGPDDKPLMSNSGISTDKTKYNTSIEKNGFILTILNLTVEDLNVSYTCSCGFGIDNHILYIEDVYTVDNLSKSINGTNYVGTIDVGWGVIIGYIAIPVILIILLIIVIKRHWLWRKLKEKIYGPRRRNSEEADKQYVIVPLLETIHVDSNLRQCSDEVDRHNVTFPLLDPNPIQCSDEDSQRVTDPLLQSTPVDSNPRQSSDEVDRHNVAVPLLDPNPIQCSGSLLPQDHSSILNRLLGYGSYESFEMRVMVTGQFGVGKTSLVMILVGDEAPHEAQSTDGISLLEGRCGLDIENRDWILIAKDDYNARDVVYQKVLVTPKPKDKATGQNKHTKTKDASLKRHHLEQAIPEEIDTKPPPMVLLDTTEAAKKDKKIKSKEIVQLKPVQILEKSKMKSKMTKKEIKKQMEKVLKRGDYKMKVGRLLFWDFGGQYVYYTTHQTFMTYRALFLVVFDGSTDLYDEVPDVLCFPGQHGTPTPAVFLQHWVNSILTYCKVISGEIPQILFVATHKDKILEKDVEKRRTSIYNGIDQLFKHHDGRNHLVLKHCVFVNAMNRNDPEIEILKKIITELTFNHPCWGERMPNAWIPLELEIAELTAEGRQIMSLKDIEELNNASEVSTLSSEDLKTFLQIQHSLGKIVYFDTPQLKDYVVISPLYMVEVMKSFVTDRQFWPKDSKAKETFNKMSVHGVIQKSDLFLLWERKEFSKILQYKEYVFDMLVHLDILSEQRRYDRYTGTRLPVEDFFVPCMVTEQYTTNYMENECTPQRAICLAFVFKGSIIPPALPNRLIGACLSMWRLKTYEGKKLMFSGFIGLTIDKSHDIIVRVESNKILLFILHKTSKGLIIRDIATGVKECLHATLKRISEFYQSASNKNSSQQQPFHVELACSNFKCFLPETEAKASENNRLICEGCNQNYEIEIWNQDKTTDNCRQSCTGLCGDALAQHPTDREIGRFSNQFNAEMIRKLVKHLGLNETEWENMRDNHQYNIEVVKCLILIKWREQNTGIFRDLAEALTAMNVTTHKLCQVRRDKIAKNRDLLAEHMEYIPTDEILDALAPEIGQLSFNLGIELGLRAVDLERIQHDYERNLVNQTKQVLYEWRNDTTVRATLGVLEQALVNVGRGAMCLKTVVETIGVEKRHNYRQ